MALQVKKMYNANAYVDGVSFLGKTEEVELPEIMAKMVEHKALGMIGGIELPSGWEKMEATIKWNSFYPDAMVKAADPFKTHNLQLRASLEELGSSRKNHIGSLRCFHDDSIQRYSCRWFQAARERGVRKRIERPVYPHRG